MGEPWVRSSRSASSQAKHEIRSHSDRRKENERLGSFCMIALAPHHSDRVGFGRALARAAPHVPEALREKRAWRAARVRF